MKRTYSEAFSGTHAPKELQENFHFSVYEEVELTEGYLPLKSIMFQFVSGLSDFTTLNGFGDDLTILSHGGINHLCEIQSFVDKKTFNTYAIFYRLKIMTPLVDCYGIGEDSWVVSNNEKELSFIVTTKTYITEKDTKMLSTMYHMDIIHSEHSLRINIIKGIDKFNDIKIKFN